MANLDNVKVVNENTVEYNGFVYELVTDGGNVGDLIQCFEHDDWLIRGGFYYVYEIDSDGDMVFNDEENDDRYRNPDSIHWKVFRKSHAITIDKLTNAEGVVKIELPDGTKLEGTPTDLEKITRSMQALQAEQVATVEVPEEVLEAKQALLKEGGFARVIANTTDHHFEIGTVVKLDDYTPSTDAFSAYYLDESDYWRAYRKDLEPLTKEETEHIAREAEEEKKAKAEREEKEAERLKWADIGREVGELRKGDLVKWKGKYHDVNEVAPTHRKSTGTAFCCHDEGVTLGEDEDWAAVSNVELIVPVEQRFDTVG